MHKQKIAESGGLTWYVLGRDSQRSENVIDTLEYLLKTDDQAMLLDPGGTEIFPHVVAAVGELVDLQAISHFFCSHQDPDIMSSLPLWMGLATSARVYMPSMWASFIAHFGHEYVSRFVKVPDEGMTIQFQKHELQLVPAHYLHSSGNLHLYDPHNKVLFSGDVGAALLPEHQQNLYVTDFDNHVRHMDYFHRRWMPSNSAKNHWIQRVRKLEIDYLCPQHGAVFRGKDVQRFLDWFEQLEVGSAIKS